MDENEYNIITHELIRELVRTDYISDELADLGAEDDKLPHLAAAQHEMWFAQNADSTEGIEQYNDIREEIREKAKTRLATIIEEHDIENEIITG